MPGGSGFPSGA